MQAKFDTGYTNYSARMAEKLLGDLELAVMHVIWTQQKVTVRDVADALAETRPLAYTTIMTVMTRLTEKGLLRQHRQGRAYEYEAVYTLEELATRSAGQAIRTLLADFGPVAVTEFVHQVGQLDPGQLQRLAELAQEAVDHETL
jgi:predicted transcriptional regulator